MADETTALTRRHLLMRTGGLAAVGLPLLLLQACAPAASTSATKPSATGAPGGATLPTYLPFQGQSQPDLPDLPGDASGLDPGCFKFRSQLMQTVPKRRVVAVTSRPLWSRPTRLRPPPTRTPPVTP
jgi:hypothetical protein